MKKIIVVIFLVMFIGILAADEIDKKTIVHVGAGALSYSGLYVGLSSAFDADPITIHEASVVGSLIIFTAHELVQNKWQGIDFWDFTGDVVGMAGASYFWKGSKPKIYPKYYGKKKAIGIEFAFAFDLPGSKKVNRKE